MLPALFAVSLLSLFSGDWITTGLTIAGVVFAFLGARSIPAGKQAGPLVRLSQRASTLLQHVNSLGVPAMGPLIRELSQGNFSTLPAAVHALLDQLDDKNLRGPILDQLFYAQLERQLGDETRRHKLLTELHNRGLLDATTPTG